LAERIVSDACARSPSGRKTRWEDDRVRRLNHGYTNATVGDDAKVIKTYAGPRAAVRAEREYTALTALAGRVPVPAVLGRTAETLTLACVPGAHSSRTSGSRTVRVGRCGGNVSTRPRRGATDALDDRYGVSCCSVML